MTKDRGIQPQGHQGPTFPWLPRLLIMGDRELVLPVYEKSGFLLTKVSSWFGGHTPAREAERGRDFVRPVKQR